MRSPLGAPSAAFVEEGLEAAVDRHMVDLLEHAASGSVWTETMEIVERTLLDRALDRCGGVRLRAAEVLGIHRNTLRKKADEFGL